MNAELAVVKPSDFGIEEVKASEIEQSFAPKIAERDGYVGVYELILTKEISKEVCAEASELRKKLVKVRTGIAEIHKTEKAFYLASGKYVDALKNKHTLPIEQMEEKLSEIEKFYENAEKERIAKVQSERENELLPYEVENISALNLGTMAQEVYEAFLSAQVKKFNDKKEAELKAEQERIEREKVEAEEREKQRLENIRLKEEADKREAEIKAEREKVEAERKAAESEAKRIADETAKREAEAKAKADAEQEKLRKEAQAKIEAERKERERVEAELKAKQDQEAKAKREAEEREQAELAKGDAAKMQDFKNDLEVLKTKYTFKSSKHTKAYSEAGLLIDKIITHLSK